MTNVHEILEKVRGARQRMPPNEAATLFAAAVRLAAAQGATLRARLVQIDDTGGLHLVPFDDQAPESEPGYLAPELLGADAPRKSEPRVQVYAAGALGFELLTGHVPPGNLAELAGPLGDIVRMAVSPDRRERFGDLTQLQDALEGVQPRPPSEGERNIFLALKTRWMRAPPEKEALARLIEKLTQVETQVLQLSRAQGRLEASLRESQEQLDRFQDGQQRLRRPAPSAIGPALLAGLIAAAAVVGAGWALGLIPVSRPAPVEPPPIAKAPPADVPDAAVAEETPVSDAAAAKAPQKSAAIEKQAGTEKVPAEKAPVEKAPAEEKPAPPAETALARPAPPAGPAADEPATDAGMPVVDAGSAASALAAAPDAGETTPAAAPPQKRRTPEVTQAQLLHAVAISQIRRGESALEKGNADEALASFRAALDNEAALPVAWRGMGMAYALQGNDAQALQAYQRYLQLAPAAADKGDIRRSIAELKARAKGAAGER